MRRWTRVCSNSTNRRGPEDLSPFLSADLFVTANEEDGTISIFQGQPDRAPARYPQVVSDGIPWSALSGLVAGRGNTVYAVPDNVFFAQPHLDAQVGRMARVTAALTITKAMSQPSYDLEGIALRPQGQLVGGQRRGEDFGSASTSRKTC